MVEREGVALKDIAAILAGVAVPQQDVLARQRSRPHWDPPVSGESNDRRDGHPLTASLHVAVAIFLDARHALKNQHDGAPGGTNVDRLVARVEHEGGSLQ